MTGERHSGSPRRGRGLLLVALGILVAAVAGSGLTWATAGTGTDSATTSLSGCPQVILYFSRGSGQEVGGAGVGLASPGIDLYKALKARYGAGNVGAVANGYPAVAIRRRVLGKMLPDPRAIARYGKSVASGVRSARRNILDLLRLCPHSYLLVGGYSQGAQVTRAVLAKLNDRAQKRIGAVVLFGDPYFDPSEATVTDFPSIARKRRGILLQRPRAKAPQIDAAYTGRTFSWCHPGDFICQGPRGARKGQHGNYGNDVNAVLRKAAGPLGRLGVKPPTTVYRYTVAGTCTVGVCGLAEWAGPGTSFEAVGAAYEGQQVDITCQALGAAVSGSNRKTSSIWDKLSSGAFIPDYYVNTPGIGVRSPPIPPC